MSLDSSTADLISPSHIAMVVKDVNKTTEFLQSNLGIGPWSFIDISFEKKDMIVGEPFKLKGGYAKLAGGVYLELLEPVGASLWAEFLETHGGGLHHIAYETPDYHGTLAKLEAQGARMLTAMFYEGKPFCFLATEPAGLNVELMEGGLHDMWSP